MFAPFCGDSQSRIPDHRVIPGSNADPRERFSHLAEYRRELGMPHFKLERRSIETIRYRMGVSRRSSWLIQQGMDVLFQHL